MLESKPISDHLKKIVDKLVKEFGVENCMERSTKLNKMNKQLLEHHIADNNVVKIKETTEHIRINETAFDYLKNLITNEQK